MSKEISVGLIRPIDPKENFSSSHFSFLDTHIKKLTDEISNEKLSFNYEGLVSESVGVGVITHRIVQNTLSADIIIGIMSGLNANVMFELGLRLAQKKPTIILIDSDTQFPFDVQSFELLKYPHDLNSPDMEKFDTQFKEKLVGTWKQFLSDNGQSTFISLYQNSTQISTTVDQVSLTDAVDKLGQMMDIMTKKYVAIDSSDIFDDFNFEHDIAVNPSSIPPLNKQ